MSKSIGLVIGIIVIVIVGVAYSSTKNSDSMMMKKEVMMEQKAMEAKDQASNDTMMKKEDSPSMVAGTYEVFSPEKITLASDTKDIVLFFNASWCPSCRVVDTDLSNNAGKIPSGLTILDVDYDTSAALKKKYGVTHQHTFVQVDKVGNLIKKWSGSSNLASIVAEVK